MRRVLFVCTGNSCRSQMAEAWALALGAGRLRAMSAGAAPEPIREATIAVMAEAGISLSGHRAKGLDALPPEPWDLVVTLSHAAHEAALCAFPGKVLLRRHVADPAWAVPGTMPMEEVLAVYRVARDELRALVEELLAEESPNEPAP